jgi:hypothetical protein
MQEMHATGISMACNQMGNNLCAFFPWPNFEYIKQEYIQLNTKSHTVTFGMLDTIHHMSGVYPINVILWKLHTILILGHYLSLYSAFGKSLCTYKRCWKWCPQTTVSKNWIKQLHTLPVLHFNCCLTTEYSETAHFNGNFDTDNQIYVPQPKCTATFQTHCRMTIFIFVTTIRIKHGATTLI